ncbi:MAG TPA: hypothetical protein VFF07_03810 [Actinomycetota bacterium]|nr:hypothetical protein [Actinomycetota bacterium]
MLEDFGDGFVAELALEHWENALDVLLEHHRRSVPMVSSLLDEGSIAGPLGCRSRSMNWRKTD